ncbi:MAG TPA: transcriptional repressor [Balneolaceae bacterium]|nr:transcriptional repressor [Balneolaceae bacterium]|tara:strand:+ start:62 stop:481 length:420 start_codon:yes stop_codon:yes gene_type:complete
MNMTNHEQRLLSRNIQPTAMRIRILSFMVENKSALGLPDLEETFTHADRTTLYRTLKTFLEHGLVHQINDASGITKYALCSENCTCSYPDDVHVHFYCTSCEQTFCFPHLGIPHYDLPENFIPSHGSFVITGSCPSCSS